ncbi:MAG: queuosine salvage family protein [Deltaproteobacteria bacterium]|nr:queuosine salvage family protein [Deltaproteobacteria bacterium]
MMREVLETTKEVAEKSLQVQIDQPALDHFSGKLLGEEIEVPPWNQLYHFCGGNEEMVSYLLVLDSINFCFWPSSGKRKWEIEYQSKKLSGYYALAASLKQAVETGIPITRAEYLAEISLSELKPLLSGRGELQLLEQRIESLNELGRVLLEDYGGEAHRLVSSAGKSVVELVRLLTEKLLLFRDVAEYRGNKVFFYKRAQIFAADLYGAFQGGNWGSFIDIDKLTAFADYKLPQVLRHLGILRYEQSLAQKVDQRTILNPGSPEEVEIRANTIWAVELIRQELNRMGRGLRAFEIDWILWNLGRQVGFKIKPYHRTVTIFY